LVEQFVKQLVKQLAERFLGAKQQAEKLLMATQAKL